MPRRVGLPGAAELFRPTASTDSEPATSDAVEQVATGRVKHDEKITVYVSSSELLALEHARLRLRAEHGVAVDRGRIVRTAIGLIMADFEAQGDESGLVRALAEQ
ncbi:MAG: hypothetical protein KIT69_14605 [Propionibacteriaceae bacterium]|nr:hypothetical protein [Propionibacteriaceae bacterium]